jgi:Pentapeptide repeats (9 copies)
MASDKWWQPTWWRRQDHARGRYAPHLWPVWLVAPIWVAVAIALAVVIYLQLRAVAVPYASPNGRPASLDPLDVIKTTITVAGFVGAVLVGVYGYRKQQLAEGDAHRADAEQLAQRYTTAASQLGHEKAAVRLAGVYAMARLADDWDEQRQMCIDVLCAYLRMPYETDPASEKYREGEREVRYTIIRLIRDHLRDPSAPTTWCGRDLDFTNATFDGGNFRSAKFTGGEVSFTGTKFTGGVVSSGSTEFTDGKVSFSDAKFTGGEVSFSGAKFTGGELSFYCAEFIGSKVSFSDAVFTGCGVYFIDAKFADGTVISTARSSLAVRYPSPVRYSPEAMSHSTTRYSPTARSPSTRRSSPEVRSPSTTRDTPEVRSPSPARNTPSVAASYGVHSSPRQPGLRYKRGSGNGTNRPCNSAVTSVFGLSSWGASRQRCRDQLHQCPRSWGLVCPVGQHQQPVPQLRVG